MDNTDIVGKKFNRLTVISFSHKKQRFKPNGAKDGFVYYYLCQCECGNKIIVPKNHLKNNNTKSCGCLHKEKSSGNGKINILKAQEIHKTHGLTNKRIYRIWQGMKSRCYNSKTKFYHYYGGRGIKICDEWLFNNITFFKWALNNGYNDNLTIDRIDNNSNYCPENCRWVTRNKQSQNRRANIMITYNGETHNGTEWARITGLPVLSRLRNGWSIEKALITPKRRIA